VDDLVRRATNITTRDDGSEIGEKEDNERRGQDGSRDSVKLANSVSGGEKRGERAIAPSVYYKDFLYTNHYLDSKKWNG
jgi:hypothetical protein